MDFNKLTIKSGEAVAGAQELARRAGNPELTPRPPDRGAARAGAAADAAAARRRRPRLDPRRGGGAPAGAAVRLGRRTPSRRRAASFRKVLDDAFDEARKLDDEFVSVEHLLLALELVAARGAARRAQGRPRRPARHDAGSRGHVRGAGEVRPRPDRRRRGRASSTR